MRAKFYHLLILDGGENPEGCAGGWAPSRGDDYIKGGSQGSAPSRRRLWASGGEASSGDTPGRLGGIFQVGGSKWVAVLGMRARCNFAPGPKRVHRYYLLCMYVPISNAVGSVAGQGGRLNKWWCGYPLHSGTMYHICRGENSRSSICST